jgi:hypothetical protein
MTDDNLPDVAAISAALEALDGQISFLDETRGLPSDPPHPDLLILARARTALESLSARVTQAAEESPEMRFIREIHEMATATAWSPEQVMETAGIYRLLRSAEAERDELRGLVTQAETTTAADAMRDIEAEAREIYVAGLWEKVPERLKGNYRTVAAARLLDRPGIANEGEGNE